MQLHTQEHIDLMAQFEREFKGIRKDHKVKTFWPRGIIYQDGHANQLFLAYRRGYAFARCLYRPNSEAATGQQETVDGNRS